MILLKLIYYKNFCFIDQKCSFEHCRKIKIANNLRNNKNAVFNVLFAFLVLPSTSLVMYYIKVCYSIEVKNIFLNRKKCNFFCIKIKNTTKTFEKIYQWFYFVIHFHSRLVRFCSSLLFVCTSKSTSCECNSKWYSIRLVCLSLTYQQILN